MRAFLPLAGVALLLLAGCTPGGSPSASPTPSGAASESPTPSPTAEPAPLTIPECDILLPLADAQAAFSENTEFLGEFETSQFGIEGVPAAAAAVTGASQVRYCGWGVPFSDGAFSLLVAEISAADRATLDATLPGAGFAAITMGTVTGYDAEREGEVSTLADTLLFTGDVMIVCKGTSLDLTGVVTGSALNALRTANPTLGL
jgi:hypothetical protein